MSAVDTRVVPFPISNEQFLQAVFGDRWGEALVAYFLGDPEKSADWRVYPAADVLRVMTPSMNNYWDVSLPVPGGSRQGQDFGALYAIVLDDYGVKVVADRARTILGPPSYIIETSRQNFHAGWFIEPLTDHAWVTGMLRALYEALGRTGDNLVKPTTLVRLPVGTNGKAKNGAAGFPVKLVYWKPDNCIGRLDWPAIEKRLGTITPTLPRVSLLTGMPDPAEIEEDLVLKVFRDRGMVLDHGRSMPFGWGFEVICPWAGEHTDPRSAASYVPVKERFKCHHGHCEDRSMADVRAWADASIREDSGGLESLARLEFDDVERIGPGIAPLIAAVPSEALDLWDEPIPPSWPGGVFKDQVESEIAACARQNEFDHGGLATAVLAAVSAAADKRLRLRPYNGAKWTTPPIIWVMLIGDSGSMKSPIWETAMEPVQKAHNAAMAQWKTAQTQYRAQPAAYRQQNLPPQIRPVLVNDVTVESVQIALSHTPRGLAYVRDELSVVLDFDRYAQTPGGGQSSRAFYLESYEAKPFTLIRVKRGALHLDNTGLMIGGGTHLFRVLDHLKITGDGLMQRFIKIKLKNGPETGVVTGVTYTGIPTLDAAIERLLLVSPFDEYTLSSEGEALIRQTQAEGRTLARTTDLGQAFAAEAHKMHGLHARVALILHLLETPAQDVIGPDTVRRAKKFVNYEMAHSAQLYMQAEKRASTQAIGSYLLRLLPRQVSARDLMRNVAVCRNMTTKELNIAMEPLVNGGWAKPAEPYPNTNRVWFVNPRLQQIFPERLAEETARVAAVKQAMNQLGRYR